MPVFKLFWLLLCVLILEGCGQRQGGQTPESPNQETLSYEIGDAEVTITGYGRAAAGEVAIPEELEGLPVTSIGDMAFLNSCMTSITIPEGVTSIGDEAFSDCKSLISITIAEGVTSIGSSALWGCSSLNSIAIPQAFHSEVEASRLGLDKLWPDGFALPDSSSK